MINTAGVQSGGSTNPTNVQIVGVQSGRCAEIGNSSTTNGTQAQIWDCISGAANQRWTHTASRQLMVYGTSAWTPRARAPPTAPQW
ncbi:RICIN domain-containing protein [Micromonospora sp. M12]